MRKIDIQRKTLFPLMVFVSALVLLSSLTACAGSPNASETPAAEEQESGEPEASEETASEADTAEESAEEDSQAEEHQTDVTPAELGKTYSTEDYDIVFSEAYWDTTDEEGSWKYYDGGNISYSLGLNPGDQLFVIRTTITNKYTSAIEPSWYQAGTALINGKYEYEIDVQEADGGSHEVTPLATRDYLVYVVVPSAMKDQFENIKIDWGFDPKAESNPIEEGSYEVFELYFEN